MHIVNVLDRRIARFTVYEFFKAGWQVGVYSDGDDMDVERSRWSRANARAIVDATQAVDECWLFVWEPTAKQDEPRTGWVRLINGNSGWDVINDYTTNLEPIMAIVSEYVDKQEERYALG